MTYYSSQVQPLFNLLKNSVLLYPRALKASLIYILAIVLLENATSMLHFFPNSTAWIVVYLAVLSLVSLTLWCCALCAVHQAFCDRPWPWHQVLKSVCSRLLAITVFTLMYFGFFVLMLFWMGFLNHRIFGLDASPMMLWWLDLFFVGLPLLFFLLLFSLTIPNVLIFDLSLRDALAQSMKMVWFSQLKPALVLYGGIILFFYLITPSTSHSLWLYQHHLKFVFDLFAYLILGPFLLSYALFLVHNLDIMLRERRA